MNIYLPKSWLNEIVKTNISVQKLSELLTLRSSSVEEVVKKQGDYILDVETTVNRGDTLSILGLAREFYAICKLEGIEATFNDPFKGLNKLNTNSKKQLKITTNKKINPRFTAIVIDNVKVTDSPKYIQNRLKQVGIRPINNIVDITNYIMVLTGQPAHAFDYNKIEGGVMNVLLSKKGDTITTLDNKKHKLPVNSIIIKDKSKIIDLCGIMGGKNSQITKDTKTVVLFTQIYDKQLVRKTSLMLNHRTEAVQRFEKGIDPKLQKKALKLALKLLKDSTNYTLASKLYDLNYTNYKEHSVKLTFKKLNLYANTTIPKQKVSQVLKALGFAIQKQTDEAIFVIPPSYRASDIYIEEDLIEEVVRIYGYEKITNLLPANHFNSDLYNNKNKVERLVKYYLKDTGFNELITIAMVDKQKVNTKVAVKIDNPLGKQMEYMKTSHLPILKEATQTNTQKVSVFELSNVYKKSAKGLPSEVQKLAILSNKPNNSQLLVNTFNGIISTLNSNLKLQFSSLNEAQIVTNKNKIVGFLKINTNYSYLEVNFNDLVNSYSDYPNILLSKGFATIVEDLTIFTPVNLPAQKLIQQIKGVSKLIKQIEFKDDFLKNNKRAVTLTFYYNSNNKNLSDNDAKVVRNKIIRYIEKQLNYKVDRPK